ncbi:MAG TPA: prolyl oligopeptidase family serine peptidase [Rubrivivax sp.]|nr:prolyl oligopeptidase family serine peptidase [Rubrivivax sp.]
MHDTAGQTMPLPVASSVADSYFGTSVDDPYRALEDLGSRATQDWMRLAAAHAQATLARIPGRQALRQRLAALSAGAPVTVERVLRTPSGLLVYERRRAGENQFALVARQGFEGAERVLVDAPALAALHGGRASAVNFFSVSPDGHTLAFGSSPGGSEESVLHRIDLASGRPLGEPITRANYGVARWTADGRGFAVNRLQPDPADQREKYRGSSAWLLPADGRWAQARLLLGPGMRSVAVSPSEAPQVLFTADGRWMIGFLEDGVRNETRVLFAPAALPQQGEPEWRLLARPEDGVVDFAYGGGIFYARTHVGAPRFRIVGAPIESFAPATAPTRVPASDRVLGMLVAARDALYFQAREGNALQLWKLAHGASVAERVALPLQGHFALRQRGGVWAAHGAIDGLLMPLEDWTHAPRWVQVNAEGQVRDTGLQPPGPFDTPADVQTTEVLVPSHDGATVPLSIVHRRGQPLDGRAPTLLQGYGAYGITWEARFDAARLAWLEQGGVIAMANPRGSGVFGQAWYEAGRQATKPNTWRDMVACAEYLVAQGWASPGTLAIEGTSAGGITSGRAVTERPDLFAAGVLRVGVLDMVRAELEPNGPPNIPEFGSHATEPGFRALLAMSTYHHITPGVRYPAVLLTHGVNDPRVAVWHSSKTAARFAAASAARPDGRAVLLRLEMDAGHGVGSTRSQRDEERADIYAFLLWQMNAPGFRPPAEAR